MSKREIGKKLTAVKVAAVVAVCLFVLAIAGSVSQKSRLVANHTQCHEVQGQIQ